MIAELSVFGLTLLDPWFLLLVPLLLLAAWRRAATRRVALPTASVALFADLPRTLRQRLTWLPLVVKVLAGVCLAVAMARPVQREVVPVRGHGIDILLVVDTSSSMLQEDMRPGEPYRRMDAARERAEQFAAARSRDRVGLISFAKFAELRCPPTLDEGALAAFLRVLDTVPRGSEYDATAIGIALAKAVQVLEASEAASKVVVLLTDGENNVAPIAPEDAALLAKDAGVRVHTIGLGSGREGMFAFQRSDFSVLEQIAEATGGRFFQPKSDEDLGDVYAQIDELETDEIEDPLYRTVDRFELPLLVGLLAMLFAILFDALVVRRVP